MNDPVAYCGWFCLRCPGSDGGCVGCKAGGDDPNCQLRLCAKAKRVRACALCESYPCVQIEDMQARFPMLGENNLAIRNIGIDAWIEEQMNLAGEKYSFGS